MTNIPDPEHSEVYLGNDIYAHRNTTGDIVLRRAFSNGRRYELKLDSAVLDELLSYIEELYPPVYRSKRIETKTANTANTANMCICGHTRDRHVSTGDPIPMCLECDCCRFISTSPCQDSHTMYYYAKGGIVTTNGFCTQCGMTTQDCVI